MCRRAGGPRREAPDALARLRVELTGRHDDLRTLAGLGDRLRPLLAAVGLDLDAVIVALGVRQGGRDLARRLALHVAGPMPKRERPRCGARTRTGAPCRAPAVWDDERDRPRTRRGRCRLHGGAWTGPRTEAGREAARAALDRVNAARRACAASR